MVKALIVVLAVLAITTASAVDLDENKPRRHRRNSNAKMVPAKVMPGRALMDRKRVITVPKGDPRARPPTSASASPFSLPSSSRPVLSSGAPANTAGCAGAGGNCILQSACAGVGTIKTGLCPGAYYCCVKGAAPAPKPTPVVPVPPPVSGIRAQGVDVSTAQTVDRLKCFLNPSDPRHTVGAAAYKGGGPNLTPSQIAAIKATRFDHFGIRTPLYDNSSPIPTIQNAVAAGFSPANIDVYFISFHAAEGPAAGIQRLKNAAASLSAVKNDFGTLWLDIETGPGYWSTPTANCAYVTAIVNAIKADPVTFPWKLGIYSGIWTWGQIVGTNCPFAPFKDLPFWFAAYTAGQGDFSFFRPMTNAWNKASVRQWRGTTNFCGTAVDFNVFA